MPLELRLSVEAGVNDPLEVRFMDRPCNEVLASIRQALDLAGLRSLETFDLQAARLRAIDCSCPRHGSLDCDCQMVVLLVYGNSALPCTLVLHGSDGRAWLSMLDNAAQPVDAATLATIERIVGDVLSSNV